MKAVVIDEAYEYLRHETSAEYVETSASRCRKRTCSFRVSTQRFGPFAAHPNGQAVITNAGTAFLFQPHPDEMATLAAGTGFPKGMSRFSPVLDRGSACCGSRMGPRWRWRCSPRNTSWSWPRQAIWRNRRAGIGRKTAKSVVCRTGGVGPPGL
ncbi:MAG TPA: hypothetical protein VMW83_10045 [Spirochaetia bacterium]|nr:hypothetical protein [Spirochaetia bacterium]